MSSMLAKLKQSQKSDVDLKELFAAFPKLKAQIAEVIWKVDSRQVNCLWLKLAFEWKGERVLHEFKYAPMHLPELAKRMEAAGIADIKPLEVYEFEVVQFRIGYPRYYPILAKKSGKP